MAPSHRELLFLLFLFLVMEKNKVGQGHLLFYAVFLCELNRSSGCEMRSHGCPRYSPVLSLFGVCSNDPKAVQAGASKPPKMPLLSIFSPWINLEASVRSALWKCSLPGASDKDVLMFSVDR